MSEGDTGASTAATLIDALLADGEPVDEGSFTLDPVAAATKMKAFRYADRSRYLIPIVEAMHGLDATRVALIGEGVDFTLQASAVDLPEPSRTLFELYSCALGTADTALGRALARLAVGVDMGLGHGSIERIVISYSTGRATITAEFREGVAPKIVRGPAGPAGSLRVFVDRPWSGTFASDGTASRELEHLRKAVRYSRRPVVIDGKMASQRVREWWRARRGEGEGYRYEVGIEQTGERGSEVELWTAGVQVDRMPIPGIAVRAALHLDTLRRDLSQMQVIRDELIEQGLVDIEEAREGLLEELEQADKDWTYERPPEWSMQRVDRVLERSERSPMAPPTAPLTTAAEDGRKNGPILGSLCYVAGIGVGAGAVERVDEDPFGAMYTLLIALTFGGFGAMLLGHWLGADPDSQEQLTRWFGWGAFVLAVLGGLTGTFTVHW